ncbi:SDR family NAD(P)-dependent oxidoreductase [Sediminispirochaeta smaragdinae]|uniref:Short-chain dehydrogenase/reductase SDR n=1 Tax=Sediminispirochaeta smaragdinae (strain DSM 11293 / JCM 15392 / SEBR 4228) TaxID=573413 RepID=E1RB11_SEDSS|nr:SDR family NAD(P)-dependent oxidoreductase [Sediminispirochaeta smaragdinae]ADK79541.1 short-chain dehydrogenase/reductase SDR [Sediminispirochaeta smaragdinae DSM 11293]
MISVFLTGATGGLGKAFAVECACRGWNLFLTDRQTASLRILAESLQRQFSCSVEYYPCDLTDTRSREELYHYIKGEGLQFNMLINVAGLDYEGPFLERSGSEVRNLLRLNIESSLETTAELFRLREEGKPFRIITVASLAAFYPMPIKAMYAASKRFLLNFFVAFREEIRDAGGSVTILCPAGMPTRPDLIDSIESQGIMGRITTRNVGMVASKTIDSALRNRLIYIPGRINNVLRSLGLLMPMQLVAAVIGSRWKNRRAKRNMAFL